MMTRSRMTVPAVVDNGLRPIRTAAVVVVIATVAAGAALLRHQPLSWDEAVTVAVATRPVHAIAGTVQHSDAVLGLYYLLMHGWGTSLSAVGVRPTEWWWRLPSALAAVATCALVARLASRRAGPVAGLLAGVLLAVLPLFAFYAVDARPYTLGALTVTAAWATWTAPTGQPRSLSRATVVVVLLVTAAWLQLFTLLVWPAFAIVARRTQARRALCTLVFAAAGATPLLVVAVDQRSEIAWVPPATPANTLSVMVHVGGGLAVVGSATVLFALAARAGLVRRSPMTLATAWWACAPVTLLAALDVVRPVLVARYALVSLPLGAVAFGVLVTRAARGRTGLAVRAVAGATLVAGVVTSSLQGAQPWKYEDYRGAAAFATRAVAPGTSVLFAPSSARLGFDLYARGSALHDLALPAGVGSDPLTITELIPPLLPELVSGQCALVLVGDPVTAEPAEPAEPAGRSDADGAKLAAVSGWATQTAHRFGQITVSVLRNPACADRPSRRA